MDNIIESVTSQYSQNPTTMKIERVAAYVRVSSQEQKLHGLSLDAQKMKLTEFAKANNMKIVEWYMDEGVSGRKLIRKRPELQRMIQDAENRKFDRIIFIKLDRFFRSVAEYHECMKRIAPVLWTTTEEDYDLTTANGRMLVNMKLTIAELEADQTGERINIVNEYKLTTGQPLTGSMPFSHTIQEDEHTRRKKIIRNPETEPIVRDLLDHYFTHQSKRGAIIYLKVKYNIVMSMATIGKLLANTMLYGAYRDNPQYCEPYMDKETFDRLQEIVKRNIKENNAENRTYLFTGLLKCPECGRNMKGTYFVEKRKDTRYELKKYRCSRNRMNFSCPHRTVVNEVVLERQLLANIDKLLEDAKLRAAEVKESNEAPVPKFDIDAINEQIERLNYSWQTGKIRKVEQYERQYAELIEKLEEAEAELGHVEVKDFSKIDALLHAGWKEIYNKLDDDHKRAFWRSFIRSIDLEWNKTTKRIVRVNFF